MADKKKSGSQFNVLLIEDDKPLVKEFIKKIRRYRDDLNFINVDNLSDALGIIKQDSIRVIILDLILDGWNGLDLLQLIHEQKLKTPPIIVISAISNSSTVVKAVKLGAIDYITKPFNFDEVVKKIEQVIIRSYPSGETIDLVEPDASHVNLNTIDYSGINPVPLTHNQTMKDILAKVKKITATDCTVLIGGETGTGKELLARYIHSLSPRRGLAMVTVNCGAIPQELFESEAFGHTRGSFTGAVADKAGFFEIANHSTLFLDEIGDLSPAHQVKLLRAIQDRKVCRVGAAKLIPLDVRIICATNKDLEQEISGGKFREDLFYRIRDFFIYLPPLRERREDILPLVYYFIHKYNREFNRAVVKIDANLLNLMLTKQWKGNIRELEFTIKNLILEQSGTTLNFESVPKNIIFPDMKPPIKSHEQIFPLRQAYGIFHKAIIQAAVESSAGCRQTAGDKLGITREHLSRLITKYKLNV